MQFLVNTILMMIDLQNILLKKSVQFLVINRYFKSASIQPSTLIHIKGIKVCAGLGCLCEF